MGMTPGKIGFLKNITTKEKMLATSNFAFSNHVPNSIFYYCKSAFSFVESKMCKKEMST